MNYSRQIRWLYLVTRVRKLGPAELDPPLLHTVVNPLFVTNTKLNKEMQGQGSIGRVQSTLLPVQRVQLLFRCFSSGQDYHNIHCELESKDQGPMQGNKAKQQIYVRSPQLCSSSLPHFFKKHFCTFNTH